MATTGKRGRWLAIVAMLSGGLLIHATDAAEARRPSVVPPQSRPRGASYAEWSARWWQWAFSTEATEMGPFDEGTVDCGVNQPQRKVWFLAGPFNASGAVDRTCTVPVGTMLLVPVINVECSDLEDPPFFGATPGERAACVEADLFAFGDLEVTVDGKQVDDLERFAVTSPDFAFTGVPGNPVGLLGAGFSTSRGVYVMLTPLPPGTHTVTFTGSFPEVGFTASATYTIVMTRR
jgi:hypothetical protein